MAAMSAARLGGLILHVYTRHCTCIQLVSTAHLQETRLAHHSKRLQIFESSRVTVFLPRKAVSAQP